MLNWFSTTFVSLRPQTFHPNSFSIKAQSGLHNFMSLQKFAVWLRSLNFFFSLSQFSSRRSSRIHHNIVLPLLDLERRKHAALCLLTFDIHWTLRSIFEKATIIDKCDFQVSRDFRRKKIFSRRPKISSCHFSFAGLLLGPLRAKQSRWDAQSHDSSLDLTFSSLKTHSEWGKREKIAPYGNGAAKGKVSC
jgi:hypothetical protein